MMVIKPPRPRPHRKSNHVDNRPARKGVPKITPKSKNPKKPANQEWNQQRVEVFERIDVTNFECSGEKCGSSKKSWQRSCF